MNIAGLYERALGSRAHRGVLKGDIEIPKQKALPRTSRMSWLSVPKWRHERARNQVTYRSLQYCAQLPIELAGKLGEPSFPKELKKFILNKQNTQR